VPSVFQEFEPEDFDDEFLKNYTVVLVDIPFSGGGHLWQLYTVFIDDGKINFLVEIIHLNPNLNVHNLIFFVVISNDILDRYEIGEARVFRKYECWGVGMLGNPYQPSKNACLQGHFCWPDKGLKLRPKGRNQTPSVFGNPGLALGFKTLYNTSVPIETCRDWLDKFRPNSIPHRVSTSFVVYEGGQPAFRPPYPISPDNYITTDGGIIFPEYGFFRLSDVPGYRSRMLI